MDTFTTKLIVTIVAPIIKRTITRILSPDNAGHSIRISKLAVDPVLHARLEFQRPSIGHSQQLSAKAIQRQTKRTVGFKVQGLRIGFIILGVLSAWA